LGVYGYYRDKESCGLCAFFVSHFLHLPNGSKEEEGEHIFIKKVI
jgi:hypothetical protein